MSVLFLQGTRNAIEQSVLTTINGASLLSGAGQSNDQRIVGDTVCSYIKSISTSIFGQYSNNISVLNSKKAFGNISMIASDNTNHRIDIITQNIDANFKRPNVTSIERLKKFYTKDNNYFSILLVLYTLDRNMEL